ncbi:penicillin acylase family protein [Gammaproteobacteria bacterium]|nr:penicillin acylase family protein [Gammaproteobacteria bacterium]MDC1190671.1 penicillin acylase family protein [Gammaproteobacteria bacterium]
MLLNIRNAFALFLMCGFTSSVTSNEVQPPYSATITRDIFGVPHVHGATDADAAFGLAYAQADDDIKNILSTLDLASANSGLKSGRDGAITDYLIKALGIRELVEARYEEDLSSEVQAVLDGFVAGLNYWLSLNLNNETKDYYPVNKVDLVASFSIQNIFFAGIDNAIKELMRMPKEVSAAELDKGGESLKVASLVAGSNAFALNSNKTTDGKTRLIINSHQPLDGPVAWYEAHISSDEGWNMMGGLFPGAPFVFVGFNENLGWGMTVNKPDLTDAFKLQINPDNNNQYLLDGVWEDFETKNIKLPTKLFGPITWTFNREAKYTKHGLVLETESGSYALKFAGMKEIRQADQWFRMNKAQNKEEWLDAMKMRAIISFNAVYADKEDNIMLLHNTAGPIRNEAYDWELPVDGTKSELIWDQVTPFDEIPLLVNPNSGWVVSANQDPFRASAIADNLKRSDYSKTLGIETKMTNRAYRVIEIFDNNKKFNEQDLLDAKFDNQYSTESRSVKYLKNILETEYEDEELKDAQKILSAWDLKTDYDNRSAALGVCILQEEWRTFMNRIDAPDSKKMFKDCIDMIKDSFDRVDPLWSEVNFLMRGDLALPIQGGPDTLRAVYGRPQDDGTLKAVAGDGLVVSLAWDSLGNQESQSIHQYGSATQDSTSKHYDDQVKLFVDEQMKPTFFDKADLRNNTESIITVPFSK